MTKLNDGWNLDQGLAAQYGAQAGLDPELAAAAGSKAWDVLKSLRDAADEPNGKRRAKLAQRTRRRLKEAGLGRHRELAEQVSARLDQLSEPETPAQPSINPQTGLQEFYNCSNTDPECIDAKRSLPPPAWVNQWGANNSGHRSSSSGIEEILITGRGPDLETPWWQQPRFRPTPIELGVSGSGGGVNQSNPTEPVTAEPIDTLVHNFVYRPDGSLAPNQPGLTLYDPDIFSASGSGGNWVAQRPADPPGLASNNGLPEEVVVTGDRYKAIMDDLEDATDESLQWATQRARNDMIVNAGVPTSLGALPKFAKKNLKSGGLVGPAVGMLTGLGLAWPSVVDLSKIDAEIKRRQNLLK